jgi:hypothetical protein
MDQLGTIGLDNEVDRQAIGGPRPGRPDDGPVFLRLESGVGTASHVAADDIEHPIARPMARGVSGAAERPPTGQR